MPCSRPMYYAKHLDEVKAAMDTDDKNVRDARPAAHHGCYCRRAPRAVTAADLDDCISYKLQKKVVRTLAA